MISLTPNKSVSRVAFSILFALLLGHHIVTPAYSQIISTVAGGWVGDGGAATSAVLYFPYEVALDSAGNIYIADPNNNRIRKVAASTGIITTVAGNSGDGYSGDAGAATSATLSFPNGVAVDSAGNINISDSGNYRIRKVTSATGIITTVAGNSTSGYSGDSGAATSASLSSPQGVAVDTTGNIYIADSGNHLIRKVAVSTPPAVTTSAASSVTASGAVLNGTVNDSGEDSTVTFNYGLTNAYGSSASGGTVATGSGALAVSATLSGLACGTTYHFRVSSTNLMGTTNGADTTFTTSICSYTVGTGVVGGNGTITPGSCTVSTGQTAAFTITPNSGYQAATPIGGTCPVGTLIGTAYTTGVITADCTVSVNFITVPSAPTGITATPGNTQATVAFSAPASNGGSAITGYTVTSAPSGFVGSGTASPITVTGLTIGTTYTFTVTATNAAGTGSASAASNSVIPYPSGDIDGDGNFDLVDVEWALKGALGLITLTPEQKLKGDVAPLVNGKPSPDGLFNLGDVGVLMRKKVGLATW